MELNAKQIADILEGTIEGDADVKVNNFSKIEEGKPGTLTFLANLKYINYIYDTKASIALVDKDFKGEKELPPSLTLIRVENTYAALAILLKMVENKKVRKQGVHPKAFVCESTTIGHQEIYIGPLAYIGENVSLGENVSIYPQAYIGDNVSIGDNTIIYSGAKIYDNCSIGKNCIIHAGAVIGSDGFGFVMENGKYNKISQIGNVVIEDDVEIGANTTIDRAVIDSTIIHKGVKLDNLVMIAHNVEVGEHTAMAAQVGISGSTKVGSYCMLGGQVGLAGHIKIGNKVNIGAQSGIVSNIGDDRNIIGSPAIDVKNFFRSSIVFPKLPDMYKEIAQLHKEIELLKKK
ncbi:UDP-3-O-(3-hydroxymyristoyl)-glucosamine N-acyltransferase [Bacteroidales bacterium]|nr:UDP-3-O-(3-hydroxymyristoyl)-glucosamine N-acyltransferase [Bacteroidales bacterium]